MFKKKTPKPIALTALLTVIGFFTTLGIFTQSAFAATGFNYLNFSNMTTTGLMLAVVGLVVIILAFVPWTSSRIRVPIGIVGVIILVVGMTAFAPQQIVAPAHPVPAITIQSVSAGTYTYTADTGTIVVPVSLNYTAKTITSPTSGVVAFSFVVARTDTNTSASVFALTTSWATLTNSTTGTTSSSILRASNDTYEVHYGSQWGGNALISVASAGSTTISVSMTISPAAMLDLVLYGSTDVGINVGGNSLTVELLVSSSVK